MAKFVLYLSYSENHQLRQETRPAHREYLTELLDKGLLHEAGPFADDSGAIIVYNAESLKHAEEILANDPFSQTEGIISSVSIHEWNRVLPPVDA